MNHARGGANYGPLMLQIVSPHFVAGVVLGERAAPIVRYMVLWDEQRIRDYCAAKRWRVEVV